MTLSGNYVISKPGYTVSSSSIRSKSVELGAGLIWHPIRQRQTNLIFSFEFLGKNVSGDILVNSPLTRDRIRKMKTTVSYDFADGFKVYNYLNFSLNHGLVMLGSAELGDVNLSRAEAKPDFTHIQFDYTRLQNIKNDIMAIGRISAQGSAEPLFSSEEFGYGGTSFGRAYDSSEISGDSGISASLEVRYNGLKQWHGASLRPYAFYDIGKVWNEDTAGLRESAASSGLGFYLNHKSGLQFNFGIAFPMTRSVSTPIYGHGKSPRILGQLSFIF